MALSLDECMAIWRCGRRYGRAGLVSEYGYRNYTSARLAYLNAEMRLLEAGKIERERYLTDKGMTDGQIARLIALYDKKGAAELVKKGHAKNPSHASWFVRTLREDLCLDEQVGDLPERWSIFKANAGLVPAFGSGASEGDGHAGK